VIFGPAVLGIEAQARAHENHGRFAPSPAALAFSRLRTPLLASGSLLLSAAIGLSAALSEKSADSRAIRALAPDHGVFDASPGVPSPLNTPSILRLDGGRLVAASERGGVTSEWRKQGNPWARIATSDDGGLTWTLRATPNISQARLFQAGKAVYYLGHDGDLKILRSDDRGESWSAPADLATKKPHWYATACNVCLVILARSGDERAQSAHNGNLITFHRVRNFRALVY
jgi:hypothetical protein